MNSETPSLAYKSEFTKNSYSSQACGGLAPIYGEDTYGNYDTDYGDR